MIDIKSPSACCGCTACASICPCDAISMEPDVMGFLYPKVNKEKCVECGACERVCAFNDHYDTSMNLPQPEVYGARHKDIHEVETSRSGAVFIAISDYILRMGGVVYGAGYTDHFRVVHKRATTKEERDEFKGSKYVQSDLCGVFRQVKQDLKDGLIVLFSGTPCQTAGLNSYIGKKLRENLYLVDIVCHGTPGPYLWRDYLAYLEKKQRSEICGVNFRDKQKYGWAAHKESFKFINGDCEHKMNYTYLFYQHIMFRHSCGVCYYTNTKRPSDITLADFWHWQKTDPIVNLDNKGLSLILINSEKGKRLFDEAKTDLNVIPARLEDCIQGNMKRPSPVHSKRIRFQEDYKKYGFEYVLKKYGSDSKLDKLKKKLRYWKKKLLKK